MTLKNESEILKPDEIQNIVPEKIEEGNVKSEEVSIELQLMKDL